MPKIVKDLGYPRSFAVRDVELLRVSWRHRRLLLLAFAALATVATPSGGEPLQAATRTAILFAAHLFLVSLWMPILPMLGWDTGILLLLHWCLALQGLLLLLLLLLRHGRTALLLLLLLLLNLPWLGCRTPSLPLSISLLSRDSMPGP